MFQTRCPSVLLLQCHGLMLRAFLAVQVAGPFIKLGPLRNIEGVAEISGSLSAAGLIIILTLCLTMYGAVSFQQEKSQVGIKTLSGEPCRLYRMWRRHTFSRHSAPLTDPSKCVQALTNQCGRGSFLWCHYSSTIKKSIGQIL
jgi:hypothetical protein